MAQTIPGQPVPLNPDRHDRSEAGTVDRQIIDEKSLEALGSDKTALKAVKWDRIETDVSEEGIQETLGIKDDLATVLDREDAESAVPEMPESEVFEEAGVEYDIERHEDGSVFLLGRTGEPPLPEKAQVAPAIPEPVKPRLTLQPQPGEEIPEPIPTPQSAAETTADILRGASAGIFQAFEELTDTLGIPGTEHDLNALAEWLNERIPLEIEHELPRRTAGQVTSALAQAGTGTALGAQVTRPLNAIGGFMRWTATGALVDFAFFDPDDPGLANLAQEMGQLDSATLEAARTVFVDALAKDEDDTELVKRLKSVGEGALIGSVVDGLVLMYRGAKGLKTLPPETQKTLLKALGLTVGAGGALVLSGDQAQAGGAAKVVQELAEPFFSKAVRVVGESQTGKASPQQWKATLKNAGVKDEEIEWLGLDSFFAGKKSVSRDDLDAYVRANQVQVQDVTKGEPLPVPGLTEVSRETDEGLISIRFKTDDGRIFDIDREPGESFEILEMRPGTNIVDTNVNLAASADDVRTETEALAVIREYLAGRNDIVDIGVDTKFSSYTLPGGENYRELLLTLPGRSASTTDEMAQRQFGKRFAELTDNERDFVIRELRTEPPTNEFRGGHFDEPNVLAHVRFNEREIDGKRVLFIEEVQSDWMQKGRRQGFRGGPVDQPEIDTLTARKEELLAQRRALEMRDQFSETGVLNVEIGHIDDRLAELTGAAKVPDAPFKKTWHELAFRRMVRYAAENDFDAIGWTTGAQQADRFDLSKQVDAIDIVPRTDAATGEKTRSLLIRLPNDNAWSLGIDKNGIVDNTGASNVEMKGRPLEDIVGKDLADKIMATEGKATLEGVDLKIGGEGMAGFYDKMLPNYANKLGKKFGAKAGVGEISIGNNDDLEVVLSDGTIALRTDVDSQAHALARQHEGATVRPAGDVDETVHTFPVTDKLKQVAMKEGFPLFSAAGAGVAGAAALTGDGGEAGAAEGEFQTAGLMDKLRKPFIGQAGREAARTAPGPRVPPAPPGEAEVLKVYDVYRGGTPGRFSDEGVDFNLENLDTGDSVKALINEVSTAYADKVAVKTGGVIPHDVTRQVADLIGADPDIAEAAVRSLPGDVSQLHVRALAMRDILVASAEEVDKAAFRISQNLTAVSDDDLIAFRGILAKHAALQANMKGVQTEIARALSAFRIPAEAPNLARAQMVAEALNASGGRDTVKELASLWLKTPVEKRGKIIAESLLQKTVGTVREVWINGLLSGFRTHEINLFSNQLFMLWQIPERAGAGAFGAMTAGKRALLGQTPAADRVYFGEAPALMIGLVEGFPDAVRLGWQTFRTGDPASGLGKIEHASRRAVSAQNWGLDEASLPGRFVDLVGAGVRAPGRFLMSSDEFQKGLGRSMERRALAYRFAQNELGQGKTAAEAAQTYADVMTGRHADAEELVGDFADMITYTKRLGEAGQSMQNAAGRIPGAWIVLPFIRTPANIMKEFAKRNPITAPFMPKEFWGEITAGGARRDLALAKVSMGAAAMGWASHLAAAGTITGAGPSDHRMRRIWLQKFQPYSVKIGDKWYPYGRLEPLGMLFGVAADLTEFRQWAPRDLADEATPTLVTAAVGTMLHRISEKTFFTGIGDFAAAWQDPERYAESWAARVGGSMMPFSSMVRDVESAVDAPRSDTKRDPYETNPLAAQWNALLNEYKARVPGFNADLPNRVNHWGEEIRAYEGHWVNAFNAFAPKSDKSQPIDDELLDLRYPLSMPTRSAHGVKLDPNQYHTLVTAMNEIKAGEINPDAPPAVRDFTMREYMNWLVGTAAYNAQISEDHKIEMIKDVRSTYLAGAKQMMIMPNSPYFDSKLFTFSIQADVGKAVGIPFRP